MSWPHTLLILCGALALLWFVRCWMNPCSLLGHAWRYRRQYLTPGQNRLARRCLHCRTTQYERPGVLWGWRWQPGASAAMDSAAWQRLGQDLAPWER